MTRHGLLVASLLAALTLSTLAHAQPSDKAHAESLFRQGREKMDAGSTQQACLLFEQSQQLEPGVGTLLNLALCHEKLGRTASAWAAFVEVGIEAERLGQRDRAAFAKEHAEQLESQLARIRLIISEPAPGTTVLTDAETMSLPAEGSTLPFDPGEHHIEVRAPGKQPWSKTITAAAGRTLDVVVPQLADAPPPPPPPAAQPPPLGAPDESRSGEAHISPLVPIGFAIGGAALIIGAVTGGLSLGKAHELRKSCDGSTCPESLRDEHREAERLANASNATFAIAGVGIAVGVIGLLLSDFGGDESAAISDGTGVGVRF